MHKPIKIEDMPERRTGQTSRYPWEEWNTLKPGEALEVDPPKDVPMRVYANRLLNLKTLLRLGLRVARRNNRIFIYRPEA